MSRILVTEQIAESGLEKLRAAGHEVDIQLDLSPEGLRDAVRGAHALIVRSATAVTADVIAAGVGLVVIGRAGIGLDNVDVEAATRHGVMVANAPQSNTVSAAEHTMALLLAQARNVAQAHQALTAGRWERSAWTGVELADKTLGIVGLGRIGTLVADRAHAFGMRVIAYDPFVSAERASEAGVELTELDDLMAESDFITIHVAKTPDTVGLIGERTLRLAKPTLRLVNASRGGIVDEVALADSLRSGQIAGAALDVFSEEPCTSSPLFQLPNVLVTPHLGASTHEAQEKAGTTIAEQVSLALAGQFVPFAVNVSAAQATETVRPFLPLAELLGGLFISLCSELPPRLEIEFAGEIGGYDNKITELSVLKGLFGPGGTPVSLVNALDVAKDRGLKVKSTSTISSSEYLNVITLRSGEHAIAATLAGVNGDPRVVMVDDHLVDIAPAEHMLLIHNDDRPGVIGRVGSLLGEAKINIADMTVGHTTESARAMMVVCTTQLVPDAVLARLREADGVTDVSAMELRPSFTAPSH